MELLATALVWVVAGAFFVGQAMAILLVVAAVGFAGWEALTARLRRA